MAYSRTSYYDGIITRHIRAGRATSKTEVVHQALELLDAVTKGRGPVGSTFSNQEELESLLLAGIESGPARPMTAERWAKIRGK